MTPTPKIEIAVVAIAVLTATVAPFISALSNSVTAQTVSFPDTSDHWAQPFIARLADRNIVTGYPDGTYRPNSPVDRDEFAAIIRDAFNQSKERSISSGSAFKDVPQGYWAAPAIKEAYQTGFLSGYPGGYFRPRQPVSKVEAVSSLARNLELQKAAQTSQQSATPTASSQSTRPQPARRQGLMFPIASTALLAPLIRPVVAAAANTQSSAATPVTPNTPNQPKTQSPSALLNQYYQDANRIPAYAVDEVAAATRAGIVVNHPNVRVLNPNQPATRGEMAALIYQALVSQGRAEPIADRTTAQYIVGQR
ncbi:S-layer homology domain-containing protein [Phormidesmis priestleyi ULC007]|uniref:S-layer homology domain-containing protein n=1 Tax=Phormidesmis priestleyi ULC007 TaxID=1920490 RepID=A0A2T1DMM6_9CYAN|nr:S-layer homology domain-containing protein [Phormidesmis priestleyi ULC007]PZO54699.1 MAG: S-layer homology domain-containing protein [Phormidesmis priestleyi]